MRVEYKLNFIIFTILFLLTACSVTNLPSKVNNSINNIDTQINNHSLELNNAHNINKNNYITHSSTGYFGSQAIIQSDVDFLPPLFNNQIQIDKQFNNIKSIAADISDLIRIPILLDLNNTQDNNNCAIHITQHEGNLVELLNIITAKCDLSWSYKNGKLIFSDLATKVWNIRGIPGEIQVQNQINSNSGLQSQSGGSGQSIGDGDAVSATGTSLAKSTQNATQNTSFNLQNSIWSNLSDAVKSILSKDGKISVSPSTSTITVTDKPSVLIRVNEYIKTQNEIMSRQVQVDVHVLNVDVRSEDNYGINWGLAFKAAGAKFDINGQALASNISSGNGKIQNAVTPIFIPTATTQAFTLSSLSDSLSGSQLIINALSSIAKTSLVTSTAITTLSNQPVPVQFVDQLAYLSSITTTVTANAGTQTALTPSQVTTGFSLTILPVIQADHTVFLQLSLNISSLKNITQFASGGMANSIIQLPETLQRNLMQKAVIKSGDTFVLTGFDSDSQLINNTGVGGAYNWLLGGGVNANKIKTKMVILVTPRVLN